MKALKPCKCGSTNRAVLGGSVFLKDDYYVACGHCGAKTKKYKTEDEAVEEWNKTNKDAVAISECPFNCKYNILHMGEVIVAPTGVKHYYISCKCGAKGPEKDTEQDAIVAWNTRG